MKRVLLAALLAAIHLPAMAYYMPGEGRWTSRDPIGERGGRNILTFVGNDPVFWVDLLGLEGIFLRNPNLESNEANCPKCMTIVVGGAGDRKYGTATRTIPNHGFYYWGERAALQADMERLRKACKCTKIALIGHSWGGDTAFDVAAANTVSIEYLVTLDPVSTFDMGEWVGQDKPRNVQNWVNIYQRKTPMDAPGSLVPVVSLVTGLPSFAWDFLNFDGYVGDGSATMGHQWGHESGASTNVETGYHHADTLGMLQEPHALKDGLAGPPSPSTWQRLRENDCFAGAQPPAGGVP